MIPTYGLYVHIPFCSRICRYCDFHSILGTDEGLGVMLNAITQEHQLVREEMNLLDAAPATAYIGGGTPSIIDAEAWDSFTSALFHHVPTEELAEFSIECNPDSFSHEKSRAWVRSGVSRLSVGVQSLNDQELRILGRPHTAAQSFDILQDHALSEFQSVSADVMWGLPGQTIKSLSATLAGILASPYVRHISTYELTIAPNTPFGRHQTLLPLPQEHSMLELSDFLQATLLDAGFQRYEVSNWALPGFESRHNSSYWEHIPYLGLGPSAHSFLGKTRWANLADHPAYCSKIQKSRMAVDFIETLSGDDISKEMILLRLRTSKGLKIESFEFPFSLKSDPVLSKIWRHRASSHKRGGTLYSAMPEWIVQTELHLC